MKRVAALLLFLTACERTVRSSPAVVNSVTPPTACANVPTTVELTGEFSPLVTFAFDADPGVLLPSIALTGGAGTIDLLQPRFIDRQHMEAVVPAGTTPGTYSLTVTNPFGTSTQSDATIDVVTAAISSTITAVEPAVINGSAEIVIVGTGFVPTSEPQLVSSQNRQLVALSGVTFESPSRIHAVVPAGLQRGSYGINVSDLLAPGCPAEKGNMLNVSQAALPRVRFLSADTFAADEPFTVFACGTALIAAKVEVITPSGAITLTSIDPPLGICPPGDELVQLSGGALPAGRYSLRVTNQSDSSLFTLFDAINIVEGALHIVGPAPSLVRPRRGAAVTSGRTSSGRQVVYVVGGDQPASDSAGKSAGVSGTPLTSVEYASVTYNEQGYALSAFNESRTSLSQGRYGAAAAIAGGRFLYVFGGHTGAQVATTVQRALILPEQPLPAPTLAITPGKLPPGRYVYAVSAVMNATDEENPGGETLPSARASVVATTQSAITLSFLPLTGAASYLIYRTPAPPDVDAGTLGKMRRVGELTACADVCTFTDEVLALGVDRPLEVGALGSFATVNVANAPALFGLASEVVHDTVFLSGGSTDGTTASSQLTRFRVRADGGLEAGDTTQPLPAPAFQHSSVFAATVGIPAQPRLYVLFGRTAAQYHHAEVTLDTGALSGFLSDASPGLPQVAGGPAAAFGRKLFVFGGLFSSTILSSVQEGTTTENGSATFSTGALSLSSPRYLAGTARVGNSVFVIGGFGCSAAACASVDRITIR